MEKDIKQMIWDALNRVRGEAMVYIDNTKLLELIAATQGVERLHEILNDNELLKNILRHFSFSIPTLCHKLHIRSY